MECSRREPLGARVTSPGKWMYILSPNRPIKGYNFWIVGKSILLVAGYFFLTWILIRILEPEMTPPGFTGYGAYAMPIMLIGAFHLAGTWKKTWPFLLL